MTDFRTVPIPESEVLRHALAKADAEIAGLTARAEAAERERDALRQQAAADLEAMATFSESERRCRGERDEARQTRDEALLALGAVHAACDGHASRGRGDRTETAAERVRAIVAVKEDSARLYLSSMQVRTAERDAEREQFTAERAAFWAVVNERNEAREQRDAERAAANEWLAKLHDCQRARGDVAAVTPVDAPQIAHRPTCTFDPCNCPTTATGTVTVAPVGKPELGEWKDLGHSSGAHGRPRDSRSRGVGAFPNGRWTVWHPSRSMVVVKEGTAIDLDAAKRAADEVAREWYTIPVAPAPQPSPAPDDAERAAANEWLAKLHDCQRGRDEARADSATLRAECDRLRAYNGDKVSQERAALRGAREQGRAEGADLATAVERALDDTTGRAGVALGAYPWTILRDALVRFRAAVQVLLVALLFAPQLALAQAEPEVPPPVPGSCLDASIRFEQRHGAREYCRRGCQRGWHPPMACEVTR